MTHLVQSQTQTGPLHPHSTPLVHCPPPSFLALPTEGLKLQKACPAHGPAPHLDHLRVLLPLPAGGRLFQGWWLQLLLGDHTLPVMSPVAEISAPDCCRPTSKSTGNFRITEFV